MKPWIFFFEQPIKVGTKFSPLPRIGWDVPFRVKSCEWNKGTASYHVLAHPLWITIYI